MSNIALFAPFKRAALFQGLQPLQINKLAQNGERIAFRDGDEILTAGQESDAAFLIVCGIVRRHDPFDNAPQPTDIEVQAGTILGEMSMLIDGHEHVATFTAKGTVRAFKLTRSAVHAQMEADPDVADHFVQIIAGRLRDVADELRRIDQTLAPKPPALATGLVPGYARLDDRHA